MSLSGHPLFVFLSIIGLNTKKEAHFISEPLHVCFSVEHIGLEPITYRLPVCRSSQMS